MLHKTCCVLKIMKDLSPRVIFFVFYIFCISLCRSQFYEATLANYSKGILPEQVPLQDAPQEIINFTQSNVWPHDYYFDNPLIEKLTGYEEPLLHAHFMPYRLKDIATRFMVYTSWASTSDKYLFDINYNNESSLDQLSTLKCSKHFFLIHGWVGSHNEPHIEFLRSKILKNEDNSCIIQVDWQKGASAFSPQAAGTTILDLTIYSNQAVNTIVVGRQTGLVLFLLVYRGVWMAEDVHVIGHSFGAIIAHFAGEYYTRLVSRLEAKEISPEKAVSTPNMIPLKIGRITGLDPAARDFDSYPGGPLTLDDAFFVDVIHTSNAISQGNLLDFATFRYGTSIARGHVDFYPNDGKNVQPDCLTLEGLAKSPLVCSHYQSVLFMGDSYDKKIPRDKFQSVSCPSFSMLDVCKVEATPSMIGSMGRDANIAPGRGIQFLRYTRAD